MDVHVPYAISAELRLRGIDVLTAQEDGASELENSALLDRASSLGRILFTRDDDLLSEASRRQRSGIPFSGVIYAHQRRVTIGECVLALELIAQVCEPQEWASRVEYLPLK
jgi:predicted nuclease of predicted toxin-antitoxin system